MALDQRDETPRSRLPVETDEVGAAVSKRMNAAKPILDHLVAQGGAVVLVTREADLGQVIQQVVVNLTGMNPEEQARVAVEVAARLLSSSRLAIDAIPIKGRDRAEFNRIVNARARSILRKSRRV